MSDTQVATIRTQRELTVGRFVARAIAGTPAVVRCARYFRNWHALLKLYVRPRQLDEPFAAQGRAGFSITHWEPSDIQTTFAVFCAKDYAMPDEPEVVLDLGANIGVFSTYAVKVMRARRVIALEPVAGTFDKLKQNLSNNALEPAVIPVRKGIGGTVETRSIYVGITSPHSSLYYRGNPTYESGATEQVEVTTLDQLFREFALDRVDVCKLDCEGGEVEALMAASDDVLRRIRRLTMEYHFPGGISDRQTFFGRLERAGFRLVWHSRRGSRATFDRD